MMPNHLEICVLVALLFSKSLDLEVLIAVIMEFYLFIVMSKINIGIEVLNC